MPKPLQPQAATPQPPPCDFCQRACTKLDGKISVPVFQCASSSSSSDDAAAVLSALPPLPNDATKLVLCRTTKELMCTLASKYPGKSNLSDKTAPSRYQIFAHSKDSSSSPLPQLGHTYQVDFAPLGYYYVAKSALHGASFTALAGNVDLTGARVLELNSSSSSSSSSAVVLDFKSGEEFVLRWKHKEQQPQLVVGKTYDFSALASASSRARNVLDILPQSTCTLAGTSSSSSTFGSVQHFLQATPVRPFESGTTKVFFRQLKEEFLFLVNRYELCVLVCFTGPDADFLAELRQLGKCAGLVAHKPQRSADLEADILRLPMAATRSGKKPVLKPRALIFSPSHNNQYESIHSKFAVFGKRGAGGDGGFVPQAVWTGSFNFTNNSSAQCVENAVLLQDEEAASRYLDEFERIYAFVASTQQQPAAQEEVQEEEEEETAPQATTAMATPPKSAQQLSDARQRSQRKPVKTPGSLVKAAVMAAATPINLLAQDSPVRPTTTSSSSSSAPASTAKKTPGADTTPASAKSVYYTPKQTPSPAAVPAAKQREKKMVQPKFTETPTKPTKPTTPKE